MNHYDQFYLSGIVAICIPCLIYGLLYRSWKVWWLWRGTDGQSSTSLFQATVWTGIVFFAYGSIFWARHIRGLGFDLDDIPRNILLTLGMSVGSSVSAKGITLAYLNSGRLDKPVSSTPSPSTAQNGVPNSGGQQPQARAGYSISGLIADDAGNPDISKIQLIAWTFVSIVVYVFALVDQLQFLNHYSLAALRGSHRSLGLPDIDSALLVLMGISQGTYLGQKLVSVDTPRLSGISPNALSASTGAHVTIAGSSLGDGQGDQILVNGIPIDTVATAWTDSSIQFQWPDTQPSGARWPVGQSVSVCVIVNGQCSNNLPLLVNG